MTSSSTGLLQLLVVLMIAVGRRVNSFDVNPLDPNMKWYTPYDSYRLNLSSMGSGKDYISALNDNIIAPAVSGTTHKAYGLPVLAKQTKPWQRPSRWIMLEVVGRNGDQAMLAIRKDNLYIVGFAATNGKWFVFHNRAPLIPHATILDSEDSYAGLVGGGHWNLANLKLGRETSLRAVTTLSNYGKEYSRVADNGCLTRAVAIFAVTICEAARFDPIMLLVSNNWINSVYLGRRNDLVVNWKTISCALMVATQHRGTWGTTNQNDEATELRKLHINTAHQAAASVHFLLWPMGNKCSEVITWLK